MEIKFTTGDLQHKKLFLATPMYGGMCTGAYTKSLNELSMVCSGHGIGIQSYFIFNESLIQRARNYCVDEFLRSDCTHMLFIDADIEFGWKDVLTLLHLCDESNDMDIVCGPYPKKALAFEKILKAARTVDIQNPKELENYVGDFVFNLANGVTSFKVDEPVEVMEAGTGFMMIKRSVFETYAKKYPQNFYRPDHVRNESFDGSRQIYAYFDCEIDRGYNDAEVNKILSEVLNAKNDKALKGVKQKIVDLKAREKASSNRYLSEDYLFCQNARKAGLKVWLCPWMSLTHIGTYHFKGSLPHLASIDASPTATEESMDKFYAKETEE
ncbi:hypothetical protein PHIM7_29 [Sinorhizobium phage phiM7]|uniref:Uncharacterized protein n=2 Tax=Emdodecavirus TaxID=1980937 RepID=S5MCQ1_9CAUD|nr:hypothetical protein AB690_gp034 [Sinorhizobium phage phiM12]YP_009601154.1 hypothetical protein FDH46_gp029 [Sinorhizobium phage phiM7]AGR47674.1 hypothetical protein SmphiM12_042 [Sinorhizobium phage phiM12]AKF12577.1 hypothetical protein PHIM7_29 [Sinorhizobium phage phiM7]AKF12937.1 hypothetical protein PHIM19_30 [Sinorhizobium phage phiM19]